MRDVAVMAAPRQGRRREAPLPCRQMLRWP
jgi:hypothetical protein